MYLETASRRTPPDDPVSLISELPRSGVRAFESIRVLAQASELFAHAYVICGARESEFFCALVASNPYINEYF